MDAKIEKLIDELAVEFNVSSEIVRDCIKTASGSLREQMKSLEAPVILWPRLGTFSVNPKKIKDVELDSYKEYKSSFKKFPYRGKKRNSPVNNQEEDILKIEKGLEEIKLIQKQ